MISAIVPAAGRGSRMGTPINKQFLMLKGKPILAHTLLALETCALIDEIVVVSSKDEIEYCQRTVIVPLGLKKVTHVIAGGLERQDSVANGLAAIRGKADIILVHDGARPFVTQKILLDTISNAQTHGAAGVAVRVKDTIKVVGEDGFVSNTPPRNELWAMQTPQAFKADLLIAAYEKAISDGFCGTDDSMLVERLGYKVKIVEGIYENIKITTPDDLILGELILERLRA